MGKAKKTPAGNYRVREYIYTDENDVKHYKSFTATTKFQAELMAKEYKANWQSQNNFSITKSKPKTLKRAYEDYIALKEDVLSPSTIREYIKQSKTYFQDLMCKKVSDITQEDVQIALNYEVCRGVSPKTARNIHGLLSSVLKQVRPNFTLTTTLPQKRKHEIKIPVNDEVRCLFDAIKGTDAEVPLLISTGMGLRRSEVCALCWEDINFKKKTMVINKAIVQDKNKNWVIKSTKSTAGERVLNIPDYVFEVLKQQKSKGCIVSYNPNSLYKRYKKILGKIKLPSYRLHDLRHYTASVMLALNIPDKYAMEIMGHETDYMLKKVYQHTMKSEMIKYTTKMNDYFNAI